MEKVIVQFIKGNGSYVTGDITQIEREEVEGLLKKKMIVIIDGDCNVTNAMPDSKLPPMPQDKFICPICGNEYKQEHGLKAHKKKAHGIE
jgi:hypothetical protein